ncbi:MAG TPA: hypothetical protein VFA66_11975, partial [Gaiellaceae bacterium]|nr:hypothetical protein [Gaiellaceae bacterium]
MSYLPPTRVLRERRESARALTALFYREQAVILACGRFIVRTPLLDAKAALGWVAWESALAADALRERVFELRYPTRFLDEQAEEFHVATAGDLLELVHRVQGDYLEYGEEADPLADGPSQRIVEAAAREKGRHLGALDAFELTDEDPARDPAYFRSPVYWPDVLDPEYPYGEGVALQIRSAVSHLNEVWAVETAGRILAELSAELGWEFTLDASRWLYDETRHMLMGKERLARWGLQPGQI